MNLIINNNQIILKRSDKKTLYHYPLNVIEISAKLEGIIDFRDNENAILKNGNNKIMCKIRYIDNNIDKNKFIIKDFLLKELGINNNQKKSIDIKLIKMKNLKGKIFDKQLAGHAENSKIFLSNFLYKKIINKDFDYLVLENQYSHSSLIFNKDQIKKHRFLKNTDKYSFLINYAHKEMMNLNVPYFFYRKIYEKQKTKLDKKERELFEKSYNYKKDDRYIVRKNNKIEMKTKEVIKKRFSDGCRLVLVNKKKFVKNKNRNILNRLKMRYLNKIIGKRTLQLQTIRPYLMDEENNVARLSKGNMELLGIQSGDNIIIRSHLNQIKLRVLPFDDSETLLKLNLLKSKTNLNYSIGIPAHFRRKLKLYNLNEGCFVERDVEYIFRKKTHIQFLPTILAIITIYTTVSNEIIRNILFVLIFPFILYIMFSEEREKILNR